MELAMANGFDELSQDEMMVVDGGGVGEALLVGAGTVAVAWATPVALLGFGTAAALMALLGGAATVAGCAADFDILKY